jgi:branched-chain amino acid transport system ATP-binding protein
MILASGAVAVLDLQSVSAWYGPARALFDVSLRVEAGEMVVLQGLNGAGKSTLLKSIIGLADRASGAITWDGADITHWPSYRRAQAGLGYVAEDRRLFGALTVRENLHLAARGDVARREREVLELFPPLAGFMGRPASHTSGGEQQMVAIARTLMTSPRLLLLDEPCEGIAPLLVVAIRDALLHLKAQGMPMLVAEQNRILADRADRVVTLVSGRVGA